MFKRTSASFAFIRSIVVLTFVFATGVAQAATTIGDASVVVNVVSGTLTGNIRFLSQQELVFQDEQIRTGRNSATEITFLDGTTVRMGEESNLELTDVIFDPDPNRSIVVMTAVQGVFKFVSGNLDSTSYRIHTPVATIGIRGTVFALTVEPDGTTTVSVDEGVVTVANAAGVSEILDTAGLSTVVLPPPPEGAPPPPTPAGPPPATYTDKLRTMNSMIAVAHAGAAQARAPGARDGPDAGLSLGEGTSGAVAPVRESRITDVVVEGTMVGDRHGGETGTHPVAIGAAPMRLGATHTPTAAGVRRADVRGEEIKTGADDDVIVVAAVDKPGDGGGTTGIGRGVDRDRGLTRKDASKKSSNAASEKTSKLSLADYKIEISTLSLILAFILQREFHSSGNGRGGGSVSSLLGRLKSFIVCWLFVCVVLAVVVFVFHFAGEFGWVDFRVV